jgi:nucleoside-diphosphate-sugar epimerase
MMTKLSSSTPFEMRVGVLHTIFGEGQLWEGEKAKFPPALVAKVIRNKKFGTPIELWGDGTQKRTFLYVGDAIEMMYEVATAKEYFGPVNISSEEIVSVTQCATWVCEHAGVPATFHYNPDKPSGAHSRGVDMDWYNRHYLYRPLVSTQEGFSRMYDFMERKI